MTFVYTGSFYIHQSQKICPLFQEWENIASATSRIQIYNPQ